MKRTLSKINVLCPKRWYPTLIRLFLFTILEGPSTSSSLWQKLSIQGLKPKKKLFHNRWPLLDQTYLCSCLVRRIRGGTYAVSTDILLVWVRIHIRISASQIRSTISPCIRLEQSSCPALVDLAAFSFNYSQNSWGPHEGSIVPCCGIFQEPHNAWVD